MVQVLCFVWVFFFLIYESQNNDSQNSDHAVIFKMLYHCSSHCKEGNLKNKDPSLNKHSAEFKIPYLHGFVVPCPEYVKPYFWQNICETVNLTEFLAG